MVLGAPLLSIQSVSHRYGLHPVLDEVSLTLDGGECLLLLGQNGAGKTTLLGLLSGRLRPTQGTISIGGVVVKSGTPSALDLIGVVGHEPMLNTGLSVRENIEWFAAMAGFADPKARCKQLLTRFRLAPQGDMEVRTLSRGQQQRAGLARAMVADPPLLLLDEPFTGLDEPAREALAKELSELTRGGKSIVLTTHETALGLRIATKVCLLQGRELTAPISSGASVELDALLARLADGSAR